MQTIDLLLPSHWACALINGDLSGLDEEDDKSFEAFVDDMLKEYGSCRCISCGDDPDFRRWHDAVAYGVLACDVDIFTFDITPSHT
jgi:hypothetical protein